METPSTADGTRPSGRGRRDRPGSAVTGGSLAERLHDRLVHAVPLVDAERGSASGALFASAVDPVLWPTRPGEDGSTMDRSVTACE